MRRKAGIVTGVVAVTGLFALTASASWRTTYAGLHCVAETETSAAWYDGGNILSNSINGNFTFLCPLVRNESNVSGAVTDVQVSVLDNHASNQVSCFARSCGPEGTACDNTATKGSGLAFTGTETLELGNVEEEHLGYAYIVCSVPPKVPNNQRSGVKSYRATD